MKTIILIGMMGCGKSSVGKALALKLNMKFIDTDRLIEEMQGLSIASLFELHGEAYFRTLECELLVRLKSMAPCILSTGGGMVINPMNRILLKPLGDIVYLKASPEQLELNLKNEMHQRPILQHQTIEALMRVRDPIYQELSNVTIAIDQRTIDTIVDEIIEKTGG